MVPPFAPGVPSQSGEHHAPKEVAGVLALEHRKGGTLEAVGPHHALQSHPVATATAAAIAFTAAVPPVVAPLVALRVGLWSARLP